jgi:anaerobic selenocysteine-containing dehydrogenase
MTAPTPFALNTSFYEQDELRERQKGMSLKLNPADADGRCIRDGEPVVAWNDCGEVLFTVEVTPKVPQGVAVAEGVWWLEFAPGDRSVNALTSQRLTDQGNGSTFYDNAIDVRPAS